MNGVIGQHLLVGLGKSATSFKLKTRRVFVRDEKLMPSFPLLIAGRCYQIQFLGQDSLALCFSAAAIGKEPGTLH